MFVRLQVIPVRSEGFPHHASPLWMVTSALLLAALAACGMSADEQYAEGMRLLNADGTRPEGIAMLSSFIGGHPEDHRLPGAMLAVATASQAERDFETADTWYLRVMEDYPGSGEAEKALFLRGYMYYEDLGDSERAETILQNFIDTYPASELATSARVLLENSGKPLEEWSIIRNMETGDGHGD